MSFSQGIIRRKAWEERIKQTPGECTTDAWIQDHITEAKLETEVHLKNRAVFFLEMMLFKYIALQHCVSDPML